MGRLWSSGHVYRGQGVKKAIKREIKAEPLSSAPSTPVTIPKRPRTVSAEMFLRKWPGADTRAPNALNAPTEEEDAEEEQLEWRCFTST